MRILLLAVLAVVWPVAVSDGAGTRSATHTLAAPVPSDLMVGAERAGGPSSQAQSAPQISQCCKVCKKGKACGDSCISKTKTCHKPPGCACDAN